MSLNSNPSLPVNSLQTLRDFKTKGEKNSMQLQKSWSILKEWVHHDNQINKISKLEEKCDQIKIALKWIAQVYLYNPWEPNWPKSTSSFLVFQTLKLFCSVIILIAYSVAILYGAFLYVYLIIFSLNSWCPAHSSLQYFPILIRKPI